MPALAKISTEPAAVSTSPITDAEAGALFRACIGLFARWGLSDNEAATLLDLRPRTLARWKTGSVGNIDRDQRARMSNIVGLHKALRILFREPERAYAWPKRPNAAFGGRSALEVMLGGELTDLMRIRRYLDAERGGW